MNFQVNLNLQGWVLTCILLESFIKLPVNPYYKPPSWFMIYVHIRILNLYFVNHSNWYVPKDYLFSLFLIYSGVFAVTMKLHMKVSFLRTFLIYYSHNTIHI